MFKKVECSVPVGKNKNNNEYIVLEKCEHFSKIKFEYLINYSIFLRIFFVLQLINYILCDAFLKMRIHNLKYIFLYYVWFTIMSVYSAFNATFNLFIDFWNKINLFNNEQKKKILEKEYLELNQLTLLYDIIQSNVNLRLSQVT